MLYFHTVFIFLSHALFPSDDAALEQHVRMVILRHWAAELLAAVRELMQAKSDNEGTPSIP